MFSRRKFVAGTVAAPLLASMVPHSLAAQEGTLRIAGIDYDYSPTVVEAFQAAHPDLAVDYAPGALSFEDGQIQAALQSGDGPDAVNVNSGPGRVGQLAVSGLILNLDDFYERTGGIDRYKPGVIEQIRNQPPAGELSEVVEGLDVFQFYYHIDAFESAGVAPPETWEQFLEVCQALQDSGAQPIILGARDNFQGGWLFGNLVQSSAGREIMTEVIYGDGDFTQPDILRGAEMLKELVDANYISGMEAAALEGEQAQAAFGQGQGGMTVQQQSFPINLAGDDIDVSNIGSFVMPTRREGETSVPTAGLAHSWVISSSTQNLEAAEAWLEWVMSDDYLRLAYENGGGLVPARVVPDDIELPPAVQDAAEKVEAGAGYNPSVYLPAGGTQAWYTAMQNLITNQSSPEEAVALVQEALVEARAS